MHCASSAGARTLRPTNLITDSLSSGSTSSSPAAAQPPPCLEAGPASVWTVKRKTFHFRSAGPIKFTKPARTMYKTAESVDATTFKGSGIYQSVRRLRTRVPRTMQSRQYAAIVVKWMTRNFCRPVLGRFCGCRGDRCRHAWSNPAATSTFCECLTKSASSCSREQE